VIPWSKFESQFESTHKWSTTFCTEESPHLRVSTEDILKKNFCSSKLKIQLPRPQKKTHERKREYSRLYSSSRNGKHPAKGFLEEEENFEKVHSLQHL
jgi:hypothetical protein